VISFTPLPFIPVNRSFGAYWIEGGVDSKAILGTVEKKIIPCCCREWNPSRPVRSPVAIPTELTELSLLEQGEEEILKEK
jgi:hypothetical protein